MLPLLYVSALSPLVWQLETQDVISSFSPSTVALKLLQRWPTSQHCDSVHAGNFGIRKLGILNSAHWPMDWGLFGHGRQRSECCASHSDLGGGPVTVDYGPGYSTSHLGS